VVKLSTLVLLTIAATGPVLGGITPHEVVVVYNSTPAYLGSPDLKYPASQAVADYYCAARGIPLSNQVGVDWPALPFDSLNSPYPSEWGTPPDWIYAGDFIEDIQDPLEEFLQSHFGVDRDDPANDPIKAIVLCYGLPLVINSPQAYSSLQRTLSLPLQAGRLNSEIAQRACWRALFA